MNWPMVALGEVVDPVETWNPQRSPEASAFDYIDLSSICRESKVVRSPVRTEPAEAPSRARQKVKANDILISTVRPNLNGVAVVGDELEGATASTGFTVIRADHQKALPRYLFHWTISPSFVADMVGKATGQSYPAVSDRIVMASEIPLPPLPEQRRIAGILDAADALRRRRRRAIETLDTLQGALVAGFASLPTRIGDAAEVRSGNAFPHKEQGLEEGEFPFFKVGDMNLAGNEIEMHTSRNWINQDALDRMRAKLLPAGSVIFPKIGAAIATNKKRLLPRPSCVDNNVMALVPKEGTSSRLLLEAMRAIDLSMMASSSNPPSMRKGTVEETEVLLPDESSRAEADAALAQYDQARIAMTTHLAHLDALFAALQSRAFAGEL